MTGPAPVLHNVSATTYIKSHRSRLDALDAFHIINSTAGSLSGPPRTTSEDIRSAVSEPQEVENGMLLPFEESVSGFEDEEDDDFQDSEDIDETIKTRKGLVSLKIQPGGGRNLDLLRGLAAQSSQVLQDGRPSDSRSSYFGEMDVDNIGSRRSVSPRTTSAQGTPPPASASAYEIPELPGSVPGQGSVLLARRATALTGYGPRERKPKARTPSLPPQHAALPFPDRPALLRTSDSMAKFYEFSAILGSDSLEKQNTSYAEAYVHATTPTSSIVPNFTNDEIEAIPVMATLASLQQQSSDLASPTRASSSLSRSKSRAMTQVIEGPDMLWWQAISSDTLARGGMPEVPFASSSKLPQARKRGKALGHTQQSKASTAMVVDGKSSKSDSPTVKSMMYSDLEKLKRIKRLHRKMARLKRDDMNHPWQEVYSSSEDDEVAGEEDDVISIEKRGKEKELHRKWERGKGRFSDVDPQLLDSGLASRAGAQASQVMCGIVLQHTGFDGDFPHSAMFTATVLC